MNAEAAADDRLRWLLHGAGWELAKRVLAGRELGPWDGYCAEVDAALAERRAEVEGVGQS